MSARAAFIAGALLLCAAPAFALVGDTSITTGGTAQVLFKSAIPPHGYSVINPNLTDDCWISDSTTAAVNGQGSQRVAANGGEYRTPDNYFPSGPVSIICPTTADVVTARSW